MAKEKEKKNIQVFF